MPLVVRDASTRILWSRYGFIRGPRTLLLQSSRVYDRCGTALETHQQQTSSEHQYNIHEVSFQMDAPKLKSVIHEPRVVSFKQGSQWAEEALGTAKIFSKVGLI